MESNTTRKSLCNTEHSYILVIGYPDMICLLLEQAMAVLQSSHKLVFADNTRLLTQLMQDYIHDNQSKLRLPRVILLNKQVTGMDSSLTLGQLDSEPLLDNIPIYNLTYEPESTMALMNHECGATAYIKKPVVYDNILMLMRRVLSWIDLHPSQYEVMSAVSEQLDI